MPWLRKNSHWLLIVVGSLVWSLTMVKSGLVYDYGMSFWGPNGHDGIWHVALIESISRGSFQMPIFAGEMIKNYHLGFDVLLAGLHILTRIPVITLYFQITPPILAFLIGFLSYKLTKNNWVVLFVYFGGSLGWLLDKGESVFWSQQAISTLINPPFALSLVFLLLSLLCLQKNKYISAGLIFAILPHVKIYAGLLAFFALTVASLKNRQLLKTLFISLSLYFLTSYQLITNSARLLTWNPGWFLQTLFAPDRLNWPRWFSALTTYSQQTLSLKSLLAYILAFVVFWVGNMGIRVIWLKHKNTSWLDLFYVSVIIAGGIVPMLFLQTGTAWNTIQFFYYSLFFSSILAGLSLSKLKPNLLLSITIILLTLPTTLDTLTKVYLPPRPPAKISIAELQALDYLKKLTPGVVLTYPDSPDPYTPPPRPLYLYESTAYVSALSGQPVFLADEVNLNITSYDWQTRRQSATNFFTSPSWEFLQSNKINYIYLTSDQLIKIDLRLLGLTPLFTNSQATLYETGNN